jgi:hypothetical protein
MARIHMTRTAKIALYVLRIYLILLLALILVKFILLFSRPSSSPVSRSVPSAHRPAADPGG